MLFEAFPIKIGYYLLMEQLHSTLTVKSLMKSLGAMLSIEIWILSNGSIQIAWTWFEIEITHEKIMDLKKCAFQKLANAKKT